MDGIKPGFQTVALGSNYHNLTYNPGPGQYSAENTNSPFNQEVVKDESDASQFFSINHGGKLTRRTQWFSADKTKKFATDDKSTTQFITPTVGPGQYSPQSTIGDKGF